MRVRGVDAIDADRHRAGHPRHLAYRGKGEAAPTVGLATQAERGGRDAARAQVHNLGQALDALRRQHIIARAIGPGAQVGITVVAPAPGVAGQINGIGAVLAPDIDADYGREPRHLGGNVAAASGSKHAVGIVAPGPHGAVGLQCQRVARTGGNADDARQVGHLLGQRTGYACRSLAKAIQVVLPPGPDRAVGLEQQHVFLADRDGGQGGDAHYRRGQAGRGQHTQPQYTRQHRVSHGFDGAACRGRKPAEPPVDCSRVAALADLTLIHPH